MDTLSDVLDLVRLKGCVYFVADFAAPWGMDMDAVALAPFHLVVRGQCWMRAAGTSHRLAAGDVVLFPHGGGHCLADDPASARVPGRAVLAAQQAAQPLFQEGAESVRLLCGHFALDRDLGQPLLRELPPVVHIRGMDQRQPGLLDGVMATLVRETASRLPGAGSVVDRLAEVLFVQVLRAHLLQDGAAHGFLAALKDPRLSAAMRFIHANAAGPDGAGAGAGAANGEGDGALTLADIARAAGMSRSALAARFKAVLGMAPMAYLTQWRMLKARELLQTTGAAVPEVAAAVGYTSPAAFSRAFRRMFDSPPGAFRRTFRRTFDSPPGVFRRARR